jgi:transposase
MAVKDFQKYKESNYMRIIKRVIVKDGDLSKKERLLKDVPADTRQQAVKKFSEGLKVAKTCGRRFEMGFRSRRTHEDYFVVTKNAVKIRLQKREDGKISTHLTIFPARFKNLEAMTLRISKRSERWIQSSGGAFDSNLNLNHFASISHRKDGSWHLIILHKRHDKRWASESKPTPLDFKNDGIVALDPGVRTFQTFYSENTHGKIGDNFISKRLNILNDKIDRLSSRISTAKGKTKYNMRKRCNKLRKKVSNIVLDLHRKAASYLVNRYDTILIPNFQTKQMSSRKNRNISKPTSRGMYQLSHFAFRQRLIDVSNRHNIENLSSGLNPRSRIVVCSEAYTTKTCGKCGVINTKVGSSKVFRCSDKECGFVLDRDVNGARNILIRFITKLFEDSPLD